MNWLAWYEVRVAESLDGPCLAWFAELGFCPAVESPGSGGTLSHGELSDPVALFGAFARVRDLNLTILEVRRVEGKTP
jgi:hypothetical protein